MLLLTAIFGIDVDNGLDFLSESSKKTVSSEYSITSQGSEDSKPQVTISELSPDVRALLPDFIKAMPTNPTKDDYDGNWLRDDVEVFIAYKFPFEPNKRAAYIQLAKVIDRIGTDSGQTKDARQLTLWKDEKAALNCFNDMGFTDEELSDLTHFVLDTTNLIEGYKKVIERRDTLDQYLVDYIVIPEESCDPMIAENERTLQEWIAK